MTIKATFAIIACILCLCIIPGCLNTPGSSAGDAPSPEPTTPVAVMATSGPQPEFVTSVLALEQHKRVDGSAYRVAVVNLENVGGADALNVRVTLHLVDGSTNRIESSKSEIYERFNTDERKLLTKNLDAVWNRNYRLEIEIVYDQI
jgi:hypothetical protein